MVALIAGNDIYKLIESLMVAQLVNNTAFSAGDSSSIHGLGRSSGEENGYPLQYSCLENSMVLIGAWGATAHGVTKSQT